MNFLKLVDKIHISSDKELRKPGIKWIGVITHHTGIGDRDPGLVSDSLWATLYTNITSWLVAADKNYASAHFIIGRDGEVTMLVDPRTHIAWHAGRSSWFNSVTRRAITNCNHHFIGVELLGDGNRGDYSDAQYDKHIALSRALKWDFGMTDPRNYTGHENVAPTRKQDPGRLFDWGRYIRGVFGT